MILAFNATQHWLLLTASFSYGLGAAMSYSAAIGHLCRQDGQRDIVASLFYLTSAAVDTLFWVDLCYTLLSVGVQVSQELPHTTPPDTTKYVVQGETIPENWIQRKTQKTTKI